MQVFFFHFLFFPLLHTHTHLHPHKQGSHPHTPDVTWQTVPESEPSEGVHARSKPSPSWLRELGPSGWKLQIN